MMETIDILGLIVTCSFFIAIYFVVAGRYTAKAQQKSLGLITTKRFEVLPLIITITSALYTYQDHIEVNSTETYIRILFIFFIYLCVFLPSVILRHYEKSFRSKPNWMYYVDAAVHGIQQWYLALLTLIMMIILLLDFYSMSLLIPGVLPLLISVSAVSGALSASKIASKSSIDQFSTTTHENRLL